MRLPPLHTIVAVTVAVIFVALIWTGIIGAVS